MAVRGIVMIAVLLAGASVTQGQGEKSKVSAEFLDGLEWRCIGPAVMGGRISDVYGVPGDRDLLYAAHASAGLYKSTNGGVTFESIFDDGNTLSVGAIGVAATNPEVIYLGTGEGNPRNSVSYGDGLYRSLDGGETWRHCGLHDTERFSRIIVHPQDANIVFAGALGHEWGANEERGVFRSVDGGLTWSKVLYRNTTTGCSDIAFDTRNPNIIYAGMYDFLRQPWTFRSGGPGSGLFRSSDGGDTWVELTDPELENGLPGKKLLGRIGISVCASNANVVYAMIESQEDGELWRSNDRGHTWRMVNDDWSINFRPFYFTDIRVDPTDENRLYSLSGPLLRSTDGGVTFERIARTIHGDHQALWIDPTDPNRILNGSDGGFHISNDRGETWEFIRSMSWAQCYHINYDMAEPYNVLCGYQDNNVWRGPNEKWNTRGVKNGDWHRIHSGDGYYAEVDPRDTNIVYTNAHYGNIVRVDLRTGEKRSVQPYPVTLRGSPADHHPYRFHWNSPIHMSPNNPDVVYFGGNVLFRTTDGGQSWVEISPDLTTNDPDKIGNSGGEITPDNTSAEYHCTILSIGESPIDDQVIWVSTDDGNVQVTQDGGGSWKNVAGSIPDLPANSWAPTIHASHHDRATAYVAFDRHRSDDFAPYAYVTRDFGESWSAIKEGLNGYVHVVRDDPREPNLLYAGTELGVFCSLDGGEGWIDLRLGIPRVPVRDLKVHPRDNDLMIGTHARGAYVLDDVTPLQALAKKTLDGAALFKPLTATRYIPMSDTGNLGNQTFVAPNQPYGALITYALEHDVDADTPMALEILNEERELVRKLDVQRSAGIHRVVWNLREEPPGGVVPPTPGRRRSGLDGPRVLPGTYIVQLTIGDRERWQRFSVRMDPRRDVPMSELVEQLTAVRELLGLERQALDAIRGVESVREQAEALTSRVPPELQGKLTALDQAFEAVQDELRAEPGGYRTPARVRERISSLRRTIDSYHGRPTNAQAVWIGRFGQELNTALEHLSKAEAEHLEPLNRELRERGIGHIDPARVLEEGIQ